VTHPEATRSGAETAVSTYVLSPGTLASAAVTVCLAQVALAIPAVLTGLFTTDLGGPTSSQLTWITDAARRDRGARPSELDAALPAGASRRVAR
jgi:hypothetical protein